MNDLQDSILKILSNLQFANIQVRFRMFYDQVTRMGLSLLINRQGLFVRPVHVLISGWREHHSQCLDKYG